MIIYYNCPTCGRDITIEINFFDEKITITDEVLNQKLLEVKK